MKTFLTAVAVALMAFVAVFAVSGCNDYGNTFQNNTGAQITTLSPSNIAAGSSSFTLTISGGGFVTQTYITWNNQKLTTTDVTDAAGDVLQVSAVIPANLVATAGKALILTHNPFSGAGNNGLSNPLNFIITPTTPPIPVPLLQSINPTNVTLGSVPAQGVNLTLTGSNFLVNNGVLGATVCFNFGSITPPTPAPTQSVVCGASSAPLSVVAGTVPVSTQVVVNVPASFLATAGTGSIGIINPSTTGVNPPDGGTSGLLAFTVVTPNPLPVVTSLSPTTVAAGSAAFPLTVNGSSSAATAGNAGTGFVTNSDPTQASMVFWKVGSTATMLPLASSPAATATQITVTVPANLVASAGTASVFVVNPPVRGATPPGGGGGTSGSLGFTIGPATQGAIANAQTAAEETPAVSADGRYVAYVAAQGQHSEVFFRDTCEGAATSCQAKTTLVSVGTDGNPAAEDSHAPSMSADGRYVAFSSAATDLVSAKNAPASSAPASATPGRQIYLRDTCTGAPSGCQPSTELISTDPTGQLTGTESILPSVSASGRFVAFVAVAASQTSVAAQTPATGGSVSSAASKTTASESPAASAAAASASTNSGYRQIFVRDTCLGVANCTAKTSRISLQPGDGSDLAPAAGTAPAGPALSGDAKKVALNGSGTALLFTQSVAVDDRVFVAAVGEVK